ncbi:MAG: tRNA (N6-threonylcarbamoyladenosine(37)-N6)-methyltransferase TrmO [Ruminococcus sp.]|nr:tRNA (N6-threonylcarbamoyladenosine(37)-N6)-methyltransferase TrmO [Ruminococcus sp.]
MQIRPIARIHTDFDTKFGIPRQSGLIKELNATIIFEPEFRSPEALRELDRFSHIWLIWGFSENAGSKWSPTVRPPKLGGNKRVGVFATRSPFRPNELGLSCVELSSIEKSEKYGYILRVKGADLMNGTPIYDIKPYLPVTDRIDEAKGALTYDIHTVKVNICDELLNRLPEEKRITLIKILEQDPRPAYKDEPDRIYGFGFAGYEVKFCGSKTEITVTDIQKQA